MNSCQSAGDDELVTEHCFLLQPLRLHERTNLDYIHLKLLVSHQRSLSKMTGQFECAMFPTVWCLDSCFPDDLGEWRTLAMCYLFGRCRSPVMGLKGYTHGWFKSDLNSASWSSPCAEFCHLLLTPWTELRWWHVFPAMMPYPKKDHSSLKLFPWDTWSQWWERYRIQLYK